MQSMKNKWNLWNGRESDNVSELRTIKQVGRYLYVCIDTVTFSKRKTDEIIHGLDVVDEFSSGDLEYATQVWVLLPAQNNRETL